MSITVKDKASLKNNQLQLTSVKKCTCKTSLFSIFISTDYYSMQRI